MEGGYATLDFRGCTLSQHLSTTQEERVMKVKRVIFLGVVFIMGVALFFTGCEPQQRGLLTMNITNTETGTENNEVNAVFRPLPRGSEYEEVYITFTQVSVHKADAFSTDNETGDNPDQDNREGWIVISTEEQGFDLMALRDGAFDLLAEAELEAGKYTQIRLKITNALDEEGLPKTYVMIDGEMIPLKVPSGEQSGLKLVNPFTITPDTETVLYIDFDAERSVVETGAGQYLLKPTIKVLESMPQ